MYHWICFCFLQRHIETLFYSLGTVFYRSASLYCVDEYYILILLLTVPRRAEGSCNQFVILSKNCYACISKSYILHTSKWSTQVLTETNPAPAIERDSIFWERKTSVRLQYSLVPCSWHSSTIYCQVLSCKLLTLMGVGLLGEQYSVWVGGAEGTDALHILTKTGQLHSLILMIIT